MKRLLIIVFLPFFLPAHAQEEKGIQFEHGLSWAQIKEKAKAENKYIFLDAFTTWCGPCRMMDMEVLSTKEAGAFFNTRFINVKVQCDVTGNDNESVKSWYKDAEAIRKTYEITSYPTYLFFNPEGILIHRILGTSSASAFIRAAQDVLNPSNQFYTLRKQYDEGKRDPEFLLQLIKAARSARDNQFIPIVANEYLATQDDLLTEENLELVAVSTSKTTDRGFEILRKHQAAADAVLGAARRAGIIRGIILDEVIVPLLMNGGKVERPGGDMVVYTGKLNKDVNWTEVRKALDLQYPDISEELIMAARPMYYQLLNNWPDYSGAVSAFISAYGPQLTGDALNLYAWTILRDCGDQKLLETAAGWSEKAVSTDSKNVRFLFTYANLLYKSGKKEEAIEFQKKVVKLSESDGNDMAKVLELMQMGEKVF